MANKTGFVRVPGALTATDVNGIVAYTGDIKDDVYNKTQDVINAELLTWKASFTPPSPDIPDDLTNYYTKGLTDNLLDNKIGLSNIIQQAYGTVEGQVVSNVDFNRNTVADYTTIPSMDVFKKLVPQVLPGGTMNHVAYNKELFENSYGYLPISDRAKVPTIVEVIETINGYNYLYNPYVLTGTEADSHPAKPLSESVYSAEYLNSLMFGSGGFSGLNASSMKDYVDALSTRIFTINVTTSIGDLSTASISNSQEDIVNIITGIEEACRNNLPFIVAIKVADGVLVGNVNMLEFDYTNISAHSSQYDIYIHLSNDNYTTTSVTMKRADVSKAELEKCILMLEDVNDYPQVTNQLNRRSNAYDNIGVLDAYDIFLNNGSVPLKYNGRIYQPSSVYIRNSDNTVIVQYVDFFDIDRVLEIHISENDVAVSRETPSRILGGTILENGLYTADLDVDMPDDSHQTASIPSFLGNLYDMKIDNILIGGITVSKDYNNSLRKFVDLTDSLKQFCIWDNQDTMLAKLQNLNTSAADAYKYDFSGDGSYNVSTDFNAYQDLRNNLVLEVNGLRKKLANINVGTTYATQTALDTLAGKVYAGLYGNDTGTNTLGDTTKLQSLKAVVEWIGTNGKQYGSVAALITNKVAALQDDILGTYGNNGVLESAGTENNIKLGVKFNDNIGALNKIATLKGYTTVDEGYVIGIGPGTDSEHENMSVFDYLMELDNTAIPDAGTVAAAIISATGYAPGDATFGSRISTLETFKSAFDTNNFNVATVLSDISTLNTNVGNLSNAVDDIENTISFIDSNVVENIDHIITQITIKETDSNSQSYAEVNKTLTGDGIHPIDLTSLATRNYVNNILNGIEGLNNLTEPQITALVNLADSISNYALQSYVDNSVNTATAGMLTQVKIGNVSANVTTTPGTAAFNVNDVKTALFGTAGVLTSNSSIPWSKINFEGVTNPPITNITDDNIPPTIARKSDITITGIKRNGATVSPTNKVVNLGYTITGIRVSPRVVSSDPQLSNPTGTIIYPTSGNHDDGSNIPKTILDLAAWFHPKDPIFTIIVNGSSKDYSPSLNGFDLGENYIQGTILDDNSVDFWTESITENSTYVDEGISYGDINNYLVTAQTIKSICGSIKGAISNITPSGGDASIPIDSLSGTVLAKPNRVYKANTSLSALNIALQAPNNDNANPKAAVYTFRFTTGSTFSGLKLKIVASNATSATSNGLQNMNILYPYDITWNTNTSYEVSILYDGSSYSLKQVALQSTNTQDNTGYITIG